MSKINFISEDRNIDPIIINCQINDNLSLILKTFADNNSINVKDFDFFYNKEKINEDKTLVSLIKNETSKNIIINFHKKSKIIKCPECSNYSIVQIQNYRLFFYGCCYNHNCVPKIFDKYESTQHIEVDKIICKTNKCQKNQIEVLKDFYKCLKCSKTIGNTMYYCPDCNSKHHHQTINYEDKYYFCEDHNKEFKYYCKTCKKNLCEDCDNIHKQNRHVSKKFEEMIPDTKSIKKKLSEIKEKIEDAEIIVDQIKNNMDGAIQILRKYCEIAEDIIRKYESFNTKYKNFQVLKSVNFLKDSNKDIINDLDNIINGDKKWEKKCAILMEIYAKDRSDYTNNPESHTNNNSVEENEEFIEKANKIGVNEIISNNNGRKKNSYISNNSNIKFNFKKNK